MSSQLDPAILAAITAEARQCFLEEDAPEYIEMLGAGIQNRAEPDFNALLRAAHSLKGGAGLASLTSLQQLAHKLEDVLVGLQQDKIPEIDLAWALVENSIDEIGFVVSQAHTVDEAIANPELIVALKALVGENSESPESDEPSFGGGNNELIRSTLTEELENSFIVIEELELDTEAAVLESLLSGFADECIFMSETLELPWLAEAVAPIGEALGSDPIETLLLTKEIIVELRSSIAEHLESLEANSAELPALQGASNSLVVNTLNEDLEEL
ncbi:MAG: Hpt domain-containing protein, partial [Cyanobacteria bacterium J06623_1]